MASVAAKPMKLLLITTTCSLAVIFWGVALGVSHYMQSDLSRQLEHRPPSEALLAAEAAAAKEPKSAAAHLELARARLQDASERRDTKQLMAAVQSYKDALEIEPNNTLALLELARLCSQNGVYDKALEFLARYLTLRPDDLDAQSDYALVYLQMGEVDKAEERFIRLTAEQPRHFRSNLGLLLVAKQRGQAERAEDLLKLVLELAPDEDVRRELARAFQSRPTIASQSSARRESASEPQVGGGATESPGAALTSYFETHEIFGPKLVGFKWLAKNRLLVRLRDFPVEKMPPGMKDLMARRAQEKLNISEQIEVTLHDVQQAKDLFTFVVGGVRNSQSTNNLAGSDASEIKASESKAKVDNSLN